MSGAFVGCVGVTNVDLIYSGLDGLPSLGEEIYAKRFGMYLGGGLPATMINTGRLGLPSKILTFLGKDGFSAFARRAYAEHGADVVDLYRGDGMPVVLTSAMVCPTDRSFVSYTDGTGEDADTNEAIYRGLRGAKVVAMSPGRLDVFRRLKAEGTTLVFDTAWEYDLSIDKHREQIELADYYLPNRKEALKITGADNIEDAARVLSGFFEHVIIKLDGEGCLLSDGEGTRVIPPLPGVTAVDTTGAGDAFMAGFIYGLYHDAPIDRCIRYGNITGGTSVQAVGCLTKYVTEEELLGLADEK